MSIPKLRILAAVALAAVLPLSATACGGGGGSSSADKIVIGTKFDQPGLGMKNPDGTMSGFDVDVATYVAKELGYSPTRSSGRNRRRPSGKR